LGSQHGNQKKLERSEGLFWGVLLWKIGKRARVRIRRSNAREVLTSCELGGREIGKCPKKKKTNTSSKKWLPVSRGGGYGGKKLWKKRGKGTGQFGGSYPREGDLGSGVQEKRALAIKGGGRFR